MIADTTVKNKILALKDLGVGEFAHLNGNLESHLLGTYRLLRDWSNSEYVCDAGLYHAAYGTQPMKRLGIQHKEYSPSDREKIRDIIGEKSEQLVYLYGACDREYFYPQIGKLKVIYRNRFTGDEKELLDRTMRDLLEITMANELEICISGPSIKEKSWFHIVELFDRFKGLVSEQAYKCYNEVFKK